MIKLITNFLIHLAIFTISQGLLLFILLYLANAEADKTVNGAYCALWMILMPIVFIVSLVISFTITER